MTLSIHGHFSVRSQQALDELQQDAAAEHKRLVLVGRRGNYEVALRPERSRLGQALASLFGITARQARSLQNYRASLPTAGERFRQAVDSGSRNLAQSQAFAAQHTFGESHGAANPHADRIDMLREVTHDNRLALAQEVQKDFRHATTHLARSLSGGHTAAERRQLKDKHDAARAASNSPFIAKSGGGGFRDTLRVVEQFGSGLKEEVGKRAVQAWGEAPTPMATIAEEGEPNPASPLNPNPSRLEMRQALVEDLANLSDDKELPQAQRELARKVAERLSDDPGADLGQATITLAQGGLVPGGPGLERFARFQSPADFSALR